MEDNISVPEARELLRKWADEDNNPKLAALADRLHRKSPARRAPKKSAPMTPELAEKIREYAEDHPDAHERDIGQEFNVNAGRVSESVNHQR